MRLKTELAPGYFAPATPAQAAERDADTDGQLITKLADIANALATKGAGR
jgi:hypothetical protein